MRAWVRVGDRVRFRVRVRGRARFKDREWLISTRSVSYANFLRANQGYQTGHNSYVVEVGSGYVPCEHTAFSSGAGDLGGAAGLLGVQIGC